MVNKELLKSIAFFDDFSDEMLEKLAKIAELKDHIEGLYLEWRRLAADKMWVIVEGAVSIKLENERGDTIQLETLRDGDVMGFSSLVDLEPRKFLAYARLITPGRFLRFRAEDILSLCQQDFEFGFLMMKKMASVARDRFVSAVRLLWQIYDEKKT